MTVVLIVDNEPVVVDLLAELLTSATRQVLKADGEKAALRLANTTRPDVALIEQSIPGMGGLQLTRALKQRDPMTEVLLMSAQATLDSVIEAVDAGASDFLPKPFEDITQVAARVAQAEERVTLRREREHLYQALRESEERYRKLFEASPDGIVVFDEQTKAIRDANTAALRLYDYAKDDLIGRRLDQLRYRDSQPVVKSHEGQERGTVVIRQDADKRGCAIDVEVSTGRFHLEGSPMVVNVVRDIRERLEAEEAQRQLEAQLRHSQKMEALGLLAGGVAHDFNNLLSVITNYANFVEESLVELPANNAVTAAMKEDVEQILNAATSATSLTRQLLSFSRREVLHSEVLALNEVVTTVEKMIRRLLGEHIKLTTELNELPGAIKADRGQIEQVLINLAVNARDAMTAGGQLTMKTSVLRPAGGEPRVLLEVADTGCGMAPEVRERIFDPFYTTKEAGRGTGLGMATVKAIIERIGGNIDVLSNVSRGTRVCIDLPITKERRKQTPPPLFQPLPRGVAALVVEDDDAVRKAMVRILERAGFVISEARDGPEAVRLFRRARPPIELLITDMVMPGMSGEELASVLWKGNPELKVLFVTGYASRAKNAQFGNAKSCAILAKPFRERRLLEMVNVALALDDNRQDAFK